MTNSLNTFRTDLAETIFKQKYSHKGAETWTDLCEVLVYNVCNGLMTKSEMDSLAKFMSEKKFIPGGRYLYYANRDRKFYNNCFLLRAEEDTREDWGELAKKSVLCLMSGGGIGIDYSEYRPSDSPIKQTGGIASGPIAMLLMVNEIGRNVMQGGSRRSAIYGSLNWKHKDADKFLSLKDWDKQHVAFGISHGELKKENFNYSAPADMTNISLNYDDAFLDEIALGRLPETYLKNVEFALKNGEPGMSFNFGDKQRETLRNAPVSADTKVMTDKGYVLVKDIINKPVTVWTGKRFADTVFKLTRESDKLCIVTLTNGRKIKCSYDHPFIAKTKKGYDRVEAKDLKYNSVILNTLPVAVSEEFSLMHYTMGFVVGDGSIRNGYVDISYHSETKRECYELIKGYYSSGSTKNRCYFKIDYDSKEDYLEQYPILSASFIAGLFDADGCCAKNNLRLSSSSKELLYQVQESLQYLGIHSNVRQDGESSYVPGNVMYTLQVLSNYWSLFDALIPTKRIKLTKLEGYRTYNTRVLSVELTDIEEPVYCCDVGYAEHMFMAEGVLISNCCEVTSEDDSDVCNLGSLNFAEIGSVEELAQVTELAIKFLICGTLKAELPYEKIYKVREKNRRLGLGIMGMHEWLIKRGEKYEVTPELHTWLATYKTVSDYVSDKFADELNISRPVAKRAIAPTGTIGLICGTTTGIEPVFSVAYKRRYLVGGSTWKYQYVVEPVADYLIKTYGVDPTSIESAVDLASDYERRIKFQADVQDYVDQAISSTINLPQWGSKLNNDSTVKPFAHTLAKYAHRLRGFTCYPDGARGGQPLVPVDYSSAIKHKGVEFVETNVCDLKGGGVCGS